MNPLEQLALGWLSLARSTREWRTWAPWAPALVWFVTHLLVIGAFVFASHPLLSWAMAPLLRAISGENALRYPELFRRLPGLVTRADLVLAPWLAILASGYATLLFASAYRGRTPEPAQAWHELSGRAATLVIAALPFYVAIFATTVALEQMMAGRVSLATRLVAPRLAVAITITLQAIMLLLPPLVLLERRGLRETFAELPSALQHAFLGAIAIAAVSAWIPMPFEAWAAKSAPMVATGWPERVAVVVALRSAAQAVSLALAAGAAALLHRTVLAGREEDAW